MAIELELLWSATEVLVMWARVCLCEGICVCELVYDASLQIKHDKSQRYGYTFTHALFQAQLQPAWLTGWLAA